MVPTCLAALVATLAGHPPAAAAREIPSITGHLTDPTHLLSDADLKAANDKFDKIAQDTRIDVAGWVNDLPPEALGDLGDEAYRKWNIGGNWDNGVFLMIPKLGRWRIILNHARPELTESEVARLVAADDPGAPMARRIDGFAGTAGEILRAKIFHARPPGRSDPVLGGWFGGGAAALLLAAIAMAVLRARSRRIALR